MQQVVHKVQMPCRCGIREIVVPFESVWLDLQLQDGVITLWFIERITGTSKLLNQMNARRRINIVYTGEEFEGDWVWLRTIQHPTGLVYHVFVEAVQEEEQ